MKAIVQERYVGSADLLTPTDVDKPVPKAGEVLIRVRAAGVNPLDWHLAKGLPYIARPSMGMSGPSDKRRGVDVAGTVDALGTEMKSLKVGDEVFGWADGSFAEFATAPEDHFVGKPAGLTFEEAAAIPVAAVTALQGLRDQGRLKAGQTVLINGASGGVGSYATQIAKAMGAEVTGVCRTANVDLVRSLGADHVIDYTQEDFTRAGKIYDVVFDNAGNYSPAATLRAVTPRGILVSNSGTGGSWFGPIGRILSAQVVSRLNSGRIRIFLAKITHGDLVYLRDLAESGRLRSVIDRAYPLAKAGEAIAYVEAGHTRGKVVLSVA